jgi:predicted metalloprotease with PDZ domain
LLQVTIQPKKILQVKKDYFMKLTYNIIIETPSTHQVRVIIQGKRENNENSLDFFLPRWSPGSYLIREYSRHLSNLTAENDLGERLHIVQSDISTFTLDWSKIQKAGSKADPNSFRVSYNIFCHELTVRTSHVDSSHAFLHLPTLLFGVIGHEIENPTINLKFPASWLKLTTGLKDISTSREIFSYSAKNYDDLIDSPIEIGNQETSGFEVDGIDHDVAFYGQMLPHKENIVSDTKKIVEYISRFMGGMPYEKYSFMTHFVPGLYGGLEHNNSTALQYDPTQMTNRKGYISYLALISHEYFHTWNVKRIRPFELGPFNYLREATSNLLWLAEGLTSFMDELFIYRIGLISIEEYLEMQKDTFNRYLSIPGRKFHSLDESSFNAWIKLYRPDENSNNSSVSYYLKGGIVFFVLNIMLSKKGKSINDVLKLLWSDYKTNPERGINQEQVYKIIKDVGGEEICEKFEVMTKTTNEIDLVTICNDAKIAFEWDNSESVWLGFDPEFFGDRVIIKSVILDGPAYKAGLNAGDEILAINGIRILKDRYNDFSKFLKLNESYNFTISRLSSLNNVSLVTSQAPPKLKALKILDKTILVNILNPKE